MAHGQVRLTAGDKTLDPDHDSLRGVTHTGDQNPNTGRGHSSDKSGERDRCILRRGVGYRTHMVKL